MKNLTLILLFSIIIQNTSFAQNYTQTVKGKVVDKDSKAPLIGANVIIDNTQPVLGTSADINGNFRIENVPIGRQTIKVSYLGYEDLFIPEIMLGTGKEIVLNIELQESILKTGEITITAKREKDRALNTMATISARTFSIEETQRYAGGFNDLSRMTESFAGVSSFTGETNEIVIRGNSPRGLLWRVEGIKVANPNHFPRGSGSSGGGISIVTSDVISNSDFFTGAFPAEYGNAISGVFDINLRKGNPGKREYALQVGVIGVEAVAEGPISRKAQSSYLLNYRYSTLKIFDMLGIKLVDNSVVPEFQDITFNLNFPTKKAGNISVFGLGGMSSAGAKAKADKSEWKYNSDRFNEHELHKMGATGIKHFYIFPNRKTYLKTIISADINDNSATSDSLDDNYTKYSIYKENIVYSTIRSSILLNHKYSSKHSLRTGIIYNLLFFNMYADMLSYGTGDYIEIVNNNGQTGLLQSYLQWKYRITSELELNTGLHYMYFLLNDNYSLEPRAGIRWQFSGNQSFSAGIGLHSQVEAISFYYTESTGTGGNIYLPNKNLDFTKSYHNVLGYDISLSENLHLKAEAYYQYLYDVPVKNDTLSYFSIINYRGGLNNLAMNNDGKGYNYGLELTLEKFYSKNYYLLFTTSLFNSKYKGPDGKTYNTFYNGNYIFNLVGGKEFKVGRDKNNILATNIRFLWKGGNRMIPIDLEASIDAGSTVYEKTEIYKDKVPDFFRLDIGVSFKRNKPKFSWTVSADIQNVTDRKNVFTYRYNDDTKEIKPVLALGFIPVINYRLEF